MISSDFIFLIFLFLKLYLHKSCVYLENPEEKLSSSPLALPLKILKAM